MKKLDKSLFGAFIKEQTRNGMLSILIRPNQFRLRVSLQNGASTSKDHSTSCQDFQ